MDRQSALPPETNIVLQIQRTVNQLMKVSILHLPINLSP